MKKYWMLRADPSLMEQYLTEAQLDALQSDPALAQRMFGLALENAAAEDPDIADNFVHIGGASMPDFLGLSCGFGVF